MDSDRKEDRDEISVDQLFSKLDPITDPVVHGKIEHLPLHDRLTADNFERLVACLAAPANSLSISAFRFGKGGADKILDYLEVVHVFIRRAHSCSKALHQTR
jgi:hypothetical protein